MRCFATESVSIKVFSIDFVLLKERDNQNWQKCFKTNVDISKTFLSWSLPSCDFLYFEYWNIWEHLERLQPVANMGCKDLVLLRSHQDLAYMTHHLVAGRLSLG